MEHAIYMALNAVHNIAIVGCVAGPFYMARIVKARSQYEKRIIYDKDRLMEDVITSQPQLCWMSLMALVATGAAMPAVHFAFHGAFSQTSTVGSVALAVKLLCIGAMAGILWFGTFIFNPKLKEMFALFSADEAPDPEQETAFFALRARRKWWCDQCWRLGVVVLISSAVLRWG